MTNTESTIETASIETVVALDAIEAQDPRAAELAIGMPCTVSIGADHYGAKIVRATAGMKLLEVELEDGDRKTFRWNARIASYKTAGRRQTWRLHLGEAETRLDPSR